VARAFAPVAAVLLIAVTVVAAAGVLALVPAAPGEPPAPRGVDAEVAANGTVRLTLVAGSAVDPGSLSVRVRVDGEPLARQPPVPFFSAAGFYSGPTGAFNAASDADWRVGETVSFRIAPTNRPVPGAGDTVRVTLVVRGQVVGTGETTVGAPA
jgi:hypothetical protein